MSRTALTPDDHKLVLLLKHLISCLNPNLFIDPARFHERDLFLKSEIVFAELYDPLIGSQFLLFGRDDFFVRLCDFELEVPHLGKVDAVFGWKTLHARHLPDGFRPSVLVFLLGFV